MANIQILQKENSLHFDVANFKKAYTVEVIIEEHINDRNRITYQVWVENIEVLPSGNYLSYVTMKNFLVNNREPDLVMEQLASKCRKPFETLILVIAKNGEILGLSNHADIVERWEKTKERLELEYSGAEFEKYVSLMDSAIRNPEAFLSKIKQDIFISQFFYPIYEEAFVNYSKKNIEKIKFFNINYQIDMLLQIQDEGHLNEDESLVMLKTISDKEYSFSEMPIDSYQTRYVLDRKMEIKEIKGKFDNHNRKYLFQITEKE